MSERGTILLAGGGTGGHLYPGISVAQALAEACPELAPLFLCTNREIDAVILKPTGFQFMVQPIVPPQRNIGGLLRFWRSWRETKDLVRQVFSSTQPRAVLGLGGYAAGVAVKLAALSGLPAAILNPDVIPGRANQYLMKYVSAVCCQFEATSAHVSREHRPKLRLTGCPVRREFAMPRERAQAAARLGLHPNLLTLVITGASQGAATVNEAVLAVVSSLKLHGWQILHLAGRDHAGSVAQAYRERALPATVIDFTPEMADVWAVADLAVSRAGASTCAELTVCGVPSILMPYPYHKDMHQRANASVLADAGAAVLLDDQKDARRNAERLRPVLEGLLYDAGRRAEMAAAARALGRPDAARSVVEVLKELTQMPSRSPMPKCV
jgi:UDP-N-acetylglucosamine--N-acetylmuramyl-(pentapeptide) pyrophosphoryl-undecaprenol N-acetylglucosamine transferase